MAGLTLARWERWEPPLGGNLDLPEAERFYLEVRSGISKVALAAFQAEQPKLEVRPDEEDGPALAWQRLAAGWAKHLEPHVRMGKVPLTVDGAAVETLQQWVELVLSQADLSVWSAMLEAFVLLNSVGGKRELFSARPSGGTSGTASRSAERATGQTAAR